MQRDKTTSSGLVRTLVQRKMEEWEGNKQGRLQRHEVSVSVEGFKIEGGWGWGGGGSLNRLEATQLISGRVQSTPR